MSAGVFLAFVLVRVATYNVHSCRGLDFRMKPERIAAVIRHTRADIIALEEVRAEQARTIARQLGFDYVFGVADVLGGHEFGNAILTRYAIASSRNYGIGVPRREQRACIRADVRLPGGGPGLHVFAVHLGLSGAERKEQVNRLLSAEILEDKALHDPRILLGDFNEICNRGPVNQKLLQFLSRKNKRTYPGMLPLFPMDRIYFDAGLTLEGLRLDRSWRALVASDHAPLIGTVEVPGSSMPDAQQ